ncbi:MAG: hypothetical protein KGL39_24605 [Patescibacteria group bacterium]|nr:hypothetical protein [Patescibacteria group bacterium]
MPAKRVSRRANTPAKPGGAHPAHTRYEHLHMDITPHALAVIAARLDGKFSDFKREPVSIQQEIRNFISECEARVQHAAIGMEDQQ